MPAHRFEDFLSLGVTEIREYGNSSIQVVRIGLQISSHATLRSARTFR